MEEHFLIDKPKVILNLGHSSDLIAGGWGSCLFLLVLLLLLMMFKYIGIQATVYSALRQAIWPPPGTIGGKIVLFSVAWFER